MCSFSSGFGVTVFFSGSGFRNKVFLPLALVPDPGYVSVTDSGLRARVLQDCARAMDLLRPESLTVTWQPF